MKTLLAAAAELDGRGLAVVPIPAAGYRYTRRDGSVSTTTGKGPTVGGWQTERLSLSKVEGLLRSYGDQAAGVGVVSGKLSGNLVVLDFDGDGWQAPFEHVLHSWPELGGSPCVKTGSGKRHLWLRCPDLPSDFTSQKFTLPSLSAAVELRGNRCQALVAPSLHPSGGHYEWLTDLDEGTLAEVRFSDLHSWLCEWAGVPADDRGDGHKRAEPVEETIPEGRRNSDLASLAGTMRWRGMSESEMLAALLVANTERCRPPLPEDEVRGIAASVATYKPVAGSLPQEAEALQKDYGHAATLSAHFLGRYRWATHLGTWMEWTGQVWRPVPEERVAKAASDVLRGQYASQLATAARQDIARLAALLRDACTYSRILGALSFLKGWEDILTMPEEWDAAPWTLNVGNGLLDLRTGELRPHSPVDLCTKLAPVVYDPSAEGEHWQRHLDRFLPGVEVQRDVQRQVRRDLGRALVGATLEEALDFWYGTGANGKTTTARALQTVLGDYAKRAAPNLLVQSRNERHPTEIADLCGTRLVFSVEVDEGKQLAEALVKDLTGGDRKKARLMRQDFFEFPQTFSITLIVNHKPVIAGTDEGIWRRVRLIPWAERIPETERRPQDEVVAELVADGSGVLNWLLAGLRDWQTDHHWTAPEVIAATEAYRAEQDVLGGFLGECCELGPRFTAPVSALYEAYSVWCAGTGEDPAGKGQFGSLLRQRGIGQKRVGHERTRRWVGVRLRTSADNVSVSPYEADVFGDEPESLSSLVRIPVQQPLTEAETTYVALAEAEPPF